MNKLSHIILLLIFSVSLIAQEGKELGIEEKLGDYIPSDVVFYDENGQQVNLKSLINKPTIFMLVYYRCAGICTPLLNGVSDVVGHLDLEPGKDYDIVTISFDPTDNPKTAAEKKQNYLESVKKPVPPAAWRFLTGDSINIEKITKAVGWKYQKQGNDFAHGSGLMVLSDEGKIVRYLFGVVFLPLDMKLALTEATEGRTGPTISKLVKYCYSYDPENRKYVLNITKIMGSGVLIFVVALFLVLILKKKKPVLNNVNLSKENTNNG